MRSLEVVFPANLGDMSEAKANAINGIVQEVLTPLQEAEKEQNKKLNLSIDLNPRTMKVNVNIDESKSFLDTPSAKLVSKVAKSIFKMLFIENVGNKEVALTITNEIKHEWTNHKTILSDIEEINYPGYKCSYFHNGFIGDLVVQPDLNSREEDITDTFFQFIHRKSDFTHTNYEDEKMLENELIEMIRNAEDIYFKVSGELRDDEK